MKDLKKQPDPLSLTMKAATIVSDTQKRALFLK